jgi:hypothetical protein
MASIKIAWRVEDKEVSNRLLVEGEKVMLVVWKKEGRSEGKRLYRAGKYALVCLRSGS